jgi:DNA polymerase III subunit delta'
MAAKDLDIVDDEGHPRLVYDFINGQVQEQAFLAAYNSDRLHHAWLLTGPRGLGKATFAFRVARFLMGQNRADQILDPDHGPLAVAASDADARLIAAKAHPDLLVLEREEGKKNIPVEAVRTIGEFFSKAPSRSKYRVCIIDAVDDLNINSANALLKILEEPPERGILFLISHSPGKLLATIRSRCRRLGFTPWPEAEVKRFLSLRTDAKGDDLTRLLKLSAGSPGRGVRLWQEQALDMDILAERILSDEPPPRAELLRYAGVFKASGKQDGLRKFTLFVECLEARLREAALSAPTPLKAQAISQLWAKLSTAAAEAEGVNLDRGDYFWAMIQDLRSVV